MLGSELLCIVLYLRSNLSLICIGFSCCIRGRIGVRTSYQGVPGLLHEIVTFSLPEYECDLHDSEFQPTQLKGESLLPDFTEGGVTYENARAPRPLVYRPSSCPNTRHGRQKPTSFS